MEVPSINGGYLQYWLVVWNIFYFPIYWEQASQLTNIFRRGPVIYGGYLQYIGSYVPEMAIVFFLGGFGGIKRLTTLSHS